MKKKENLYWLSERGLVKHQKTRRRSIAKRKLYLGGLKFQNDARLNAIKTGRTYTQKRKGKSNYQKSDEYKTAPIIYVDKLAPSVFTLLYENCIPVLKFIADLKKMKKGGKYVNIVLDDVVEMGEGAIAMLLSVINELVTSGIRVKGTKPKNAGIKATLEKSGFFKYLRTVISDENNITKNTILRTGDNRTPSSELATEIRKSMETVWGVSSRCPRLFGGIIEMVRNTCDHAFQSLDSTIWHFGLSHFDDRQLVKFSFVDNGSGIIKTFTGGLLKQFLSLFRGNTDILNTAFKDGIESRTGLSWRGKGLPTIYELSTDRIIKRLVVISNDVYIDFDRDICVTLPVSYSGTYYYWEIDSNCAQSNFI